MSLHVKAAMRRLRPAGRKSPAFALLAVAAALLGFVLAGETSGLAPSTAVGKTAAQAPGGPLKPAAAPAKAPQAGPDQAVAAKLEKFQDLKFGLFIHWGPVTQWGAPIAWTITTDGWARPDSLAAWVERGKDYDRYVRDFFDLNKTFNPTAFDPAAWAEAAAGAGMKYIVFVTKCHDGFSLFKTKQTTYSITDPSCPFSADPRANVTKEVLDAFRAKGFLAGLYFPLPDWHHPDYEDLSRTPKRVFEPNYDVKAEPEKFRRYLDFAHGQIDELLTNFGPLDILWLDGGGGPEYDSEWMLKKARERQPGILYVERGKGGRYEAYRTPEQEFPATPPSYPWESCLTMGDDWAYAFNDYYKPAGELIHILVEIVSKGGNLLLDIGPDASGRLPTPAVERLAEIGDWMKLNGEAIYGTRPVAPYQEGRLRFTRKGKAVYAIQLANLGQKRPLREFKLSSIRPAEGAKVTLLGLDLPLEWTSEGSGCVIKIPSKISHRLRGDPPYCRHAWTVKISDAVVAD